jgi:hypothetical protein
MVDVKIDVEDRIEVEVGLRLKYFALFAYRDAIQVTNIDIEGDI